MCVNLSYYPLYCYQCVRQDIGAILEQSVSTLHAAVRSAQTCTGSVPPDSTAPWGRSSRSLVLMGTTWPGRIWSPRSKIWPLLIFLHSFYCELHISFMRNLILHRSCISNQIVTNFNSLSLSFLSFPFFSFFSFFSFLSFVIFKLDCSSHASVCDVCPSGSKCTTTTALPCPVGHYCPTGVSLLHAVLWYYVIFCIQSYNVMRLQDIESLSVSCSAYTFYLPSLPISFFTYLPPLPLSSLPLTFLRTTLSLHLISLPLTSPLHRPCPPPYRCTANNTAN